MSFIERGEVEQPAVPPRHEGRPHDRVGRQHRSTSAAPSAQPGERFNIVKIGDKLVDPENEPHVIGYQGIEIGEGMIRASGDPASMALVSSRSRKRKQGDRLIPTSVEIPLNFFPKAPSSQISTARSSPSLAALRRSASTTSLCMNRGYESRPRQSVTCSRSGSKAPTVRDRVEGGNVRLPDEEAGTVMVFKVV